ncbi:MAG: hypothetical protein O7G86_02365 [Gammaproteobacteria bacterium]|nr:hypothetical protein [Gammaproteobacteria bacterium]
MAEKPRNWGWVLLFTTSGTLLCCAIPIVLVSVGFGAVVASMATNLPWLITLSLYKGWMFSISGLLIALAAWAIYRPGRECPADPELAAACEQADIWNRRFIGVSGGMWSVGFISAYALEYLL